MLPTVYFENMVFLFQESIGSMARQYKQNKKASLREKYRVAQALMERLGKIAEDVSDLEVSFLNSQPNFFPVSILRRLRI